jgi:hypothetical protein
MAQTDKQLASELRALASGLVPEAERRAMTAAADRIESLATERDRMWMENESFNRFITGDGKAVLSHADWLRIAIHDLNAETVTVPLKPLWAAMAEERGRNEPDDDEWED